MADGFIPLTPQSLTVIDGLNELNRMLRELYENMAGDGDMVRIYQGYGSPENVVKASVGSLYLRLNGGATTTLYVKTSGTADTGWTAK